MAEFNQISLFDNIFVKDDSPPDDTQIVQTILYHNEADNRDFKKLCKLGIRTMYPDTFQEKGNISDFLLDLLRKHYATQNTNPTP
jgi:hypothetical protein